LEIILIAAMTKEFVIGKDNTIPWHIPGELKRFKETTMGHCLIMGRKTFESIGHCLPGRRNIVITRNAQYRAFGCEVFCSLEEALQAGRLERKMFIIGGQQLFTQSLELADFLVLSIIDRKIKGDTWFPKFSENKFVLVKQEKIDLPEPYTINTYQKRW
jgi:dihydrofolate reductase